VKRNTTACHLTKHHKIQWYMGVWRTPATNPITTKIFIHPYRIIYTLYGSSLTFAKCALISTSLHFSVFCYID
jgi:hypothetical protein